MDGGGLAVTGVELLERWWHVRLDEKVMVPDLQDKVRMSMNHLLEAADEADLVLIRFSVPPTQPVELQVAYEWLQTYREEGDKFLKNRYKGWKAASTDQHASRNTGNSTIAAAVQALYLSARRGGEQLSKAFAGASTLSSKKVAMYIEKVETTKGDIERATERLMERLDGVSVRQEPSASVQSFSQNISRPKNIQTGGTGRRSISHLEGSTQHQQSDSSRQGLMRPSQLTASRNTSSTLSVLRSQALPEVGSSSNRRMQDRGLSSGSWRSELKLPSPFLIPPSQSRSVTHGPGRGLHLTSLSENILPSPLTSSLPVGRGPGTSSQRQPSRSLHSPMSTARSPFEQGLIGTGSRQPSQRLSQPRYNAMLDSVNEDDASFDSDESGSDSGFLGGSPPTNWLDGPGEIDHGGRTPSMFEDAPSLDDLDLSADPRHRNSAYMDLGDLTLSDKV